MARVRSVHTGVYYLVSHDACHSPVEKTGSRLSYQISQITLLIHYFLQVRKHFKRESDQVGCQNEVNLAIKPTDSDLILTFRRIYKPAVMLFISTFG